MWHRSSQTVGPIWIPLFYLTAGLIEMVLLSYMFDENQVRSFQCFQVTYMADVGIEPSAYKSTCVNHYTADEHIPIRPLRSPIEILYFHTN